MVAVVCYFSGAVSVIACLFFFGSTRRSEPEPTLEPVSEAGVYVEADCRECMKLNRVPAARLRDRPLCGGCRSVLAPRRRLVICRVTSMEAMLINDLNKVWSSPTHLWDRVADHLAIPKKDAN